MPAKAKELERVAKKLGFVKSRQKGSHARWKHSDGQTTTIPIRGNAEIGGWLFREILKQMKIKNIVWRVILDEAAIAFVLRFTKSKALIWHRFLL